MNRNAILIHKEMTIVATQPHLIGGHSTYNYSLPAYCQIGDNCFSNLNPNVLALYPYLDSTSPPNSTICVGYVSTSCTRQCKIVNTNGLGSYSGAGSQHCLRNNVESYTGKRKWCVRFQLQLASTLFISLGRLE